MVEPSKSRRNRLPDRVELAEPMSLMSANQSPGARPRMGTVMIYCRCLCLFDLICVGVHVLLLTMQVHNILLQSKFTLFA